MVKEASFEEQMSQLQTIVTKLSDGNLGLDESIKQYQAGMELANQLHQRLASAEKTLAQIANEDGTLSPAEEAGDDLSNNGVQNQGYQSEFQGKM